MIKILIHIKIITIIIESIYKSIIIPTYYKIHTNNNFNINYYNMENNISLMSTKLIIIINYIDILRLVMDFSGQSSMLTLMNTSTLTSDAKKALIYWNLNKKYSIKYLLDEPFRKYMNSLVSNIKYQISINIDNYHKQLTIPVDLALNYMMFDRCSYLYNIKDIEIQNDMCLKISNCCSNFIIKDLLLLLRKAKKSNRTFSVLNLKGNIRTRYIDIDYDELYDLLGSVVKELVLDL